MHATFKLDDQLRFQTREVSDERSNRRLPTKMRIWQLQPPQLSPEHLLRWRHLLAQSTRPGDGAI